MLNQYTIKVCRVTPTLDSLLQSVHDNLASKPLLFQYP